PAGSRPRPLGDFALEGEHPRQGALLQNHQRPAGRAAQQLQARPRRPQPRPGPESRDETAAAISQTSIWRLTAVHPNTTLSSRAKRLTKWAAQSRDPCISGWITTFARLANPHPTPKRLMLK